MSSQSSPSAAQGLAHLACDRCAEIEFLMQRSEGSLHVFLLDDKRDVTLRRTLRDSDDIHAFAAQRTEGSPRDRKSAVHPLANHGDDRDVWVYGDVLDFFVRNVLREFISQCLDRALGIRCGDDEADVVL